MFTKKQKIILYVNNHSLTVGLWEGSKLQSHRAFKNNDEDHTAFSRYLATLPEIDVYLIVDAIAENYRLEALPHVVGKAKRELLERKLNQFNRHSVFRAVHFINRDTKQRKDDNYLFVALSNAELLKGWLDVIQSLQAPLVGVYLLPMISQEIVRQMKLMAPDILFCERLPSGLRQTYLHNGRVRMSRLAPMEDIESNKMAYFYLVETEKTRLYLLSQRLVLTETSLQIVLPKTDDEHQEISKNIVKNQGVECKTIDLLAYAKNNNLTHEAVRKQPELLHMQLLANGSVPDNLAPASFTKAHNLNKIGRYINISAAFVLLAGIVYALICFVIGYQQQNKTHDIVKNTEQYRQKYDLVAQDFPATPIPGKDLKIAVEIAKAVAKNSHTPHQLMQIVSEALSFSPEVVLNKMRWVQSQSADIDAKAAGNIAKMNSAQAVGSAELFQIGFIDAEISGFSGDYRSALVSVSKLTTNLRANPLVQQVVVLQEPVNVSSLANLQGSTTDTGVTQQSPAIFKLKIVLSPMQKGAKK